MREIKLPEPSGWSDDATVPYWETGKGGLISAWNEGVEVDGTLYEGDEINWLEEDALATLAAITQHRAFVAARATP